MDPSPTNPAPAGRRKFDLVGTLGTLIRSGKLFDCRDKDYVSAGCAAINDMLAGRGFLRGSLVEWLAEAPAGGATSLALIAAREAQRAGGVVAVVDRQQTFYPLGAAGWGLDLASLLLIRPRNEEDAAWALDQVLRSSHVAAVVAWPRRLDGRMFRRLQLAAESSGALGLLIRPAEVRRQPSWASVRFLVRPHPATGGDQQESRRLTLELLRHHGCFAAADQRLDLEVDSQTGEIREATAGRVAAQLADPTTAREHA